MEDSEFKWPMLAFIVLIISSSVLVGVDLFRQKTDYAICVGRLTVGADVKVCEPLSKAKP